jgi:SAM-dependent methyltransferase
MMLATRRPSHLSCEEQADVKRQTAQRFGWLWAQSDPARAPADSHYHKVRELLPTHHERGRVLDAGCGDGVDTLHLASSNNCQVVAVELSQEGVAQTARRTSGCHNVMVVRADLEHLPIQDGVFDFVYSYGVLHHLPHPELGFRELVRVLRPGGALAIYVYEDFSTRTPFERLLLRLVSAGRRATVRIPGQLLYRLCQLASPFVFAGFALSARALARFEATRTLSQRIPFRHATSPMSLTGDLYDRFAAPIECRYSRSEVERWFQQAGCSDVMVAPLRGWVGYGVKGEADDSQ